MCVDLVEILFWIRRLDTLGYVFFGDAFWIRLDTGVFGYVWILFLDTVQNIDTIYGYAHVFFGDTFGYV